MQHTGINPDKIIDQVKALQHHLRSNDQPLLNLPELAAVCIAKSCLSDCETAVKNRKSYSNSFISSISGFEKMAFSNPINAGHMLMCAKLSDASTGSAPFLRFCSDVEIEPSVNAQALYFMLPFALSNRSQFRGSSSFGAWFPSLKNSGYSKFEALADVAETPEYKDSINAIYRKLEFDFSHVIDAGLAERYGLRAAPPVQPKDHAELQKDLLQNVEKIRAQTHRTDMLKVADYTRTMEKIQACLVKGRIVKAKVLQKRVNQSNELLNSMELNRIDEGILRADLTSQYEKRAPSIAKKQQLVRRSALNENNEDWAYKFNTLADPSQFTLDQLEERVAYMEKVEATLSKYVKCK